MIIVVWTLIAHSSSSSFSSSRTHKVQQKSESTSPLEVWKITRGIFYLLIETRERSDCDKSVHAQSRYTGSVCPGVLIPRLSALFFETRNELLAQHDEVLKYASPKRRR